MELISEFWSEFSSITERYLDSRDEADLQSLLEASTDLAKRMRAAHSNCLASDAERLQAWTATCLKFCGMCAARIGNVSESIVYYRDALSVVNDTEGRVDLVDQLCKSRRISEASIEVNQIGSAILGERDSRSAARLLELVCNHSELACATKKSVIKYLVMTINSGDTIRIVVDDQLATAEDLDS